MEKKKQFTNYHQLFYKKVKIFIRFIKYEINQTINPSIDQSINRSIDQTISYFINRINIFTFTEKKYLPKNDIM